MEPSAGARQAAAVIEDAITAGRLPLADLAVFADALQRAGLRVQLPAELRAGETTAWYTVRRMRCGKPTCRCHTPGQPGHGPYVYRRSYTPGAPPARAEYVGRIRDPRRGPQRQFPQRAPPAKFDPHFLHQD
jgi:hypothetical protein